MRDISSWMARFLSEPVEALHKPHEAFKMFGSKTAATATSTFYTDLEVTTENEETLLQRIAETGRNSRDSQSLERHSATSEDGNSQDSELGTEEQQQQQQQQYSSHSFHRIASFGGFPRFQPFVMSTLSPVECTSAVTRFEETSTSIVQMSHSVLEYRSSRCFPSFLKNFID